MGNSQQAGRVLVVGATHGNERNGAWLVEVWRQRPGSLRQSGLAVELTIGNPEAHAAGRRYLDKDLNRSFAAALLEQADSPVREVRQARRLLELHGPDSPQPCLVVLDLHSTTAAMGNCLVLYGRRPADLALAAGLQGRLGLPIYLHEADPAQTGFLAERWPCGLAIEVGPVPQGVVQAAITRQTRLAVEESLAVLAAARAGQLRLPAQLVVHRHRISLDLPRRADGSAAAVIHPLRQHRDWQPIRAGEPLFIDEGGGVIAYEPPAELIGAGEGGLAWPVFINEAAYGEKGIALSLTSRECWPVQAGWGTALTAIAAALEPG